MEFSGQEFERARIIRRVTRQQVHEKTKVHPNTLMRFERGTGNTDTSTLKKLAPLYEEWTSQEGDQCGDEFSALAAEFDACVI